MRRVYRCYCESILIFIRSLSLSHVALSNESMQASVPFYCGDIYAPILQTHRDLQLWTEIEEDLIDYNMKRISQKYAKVSLKNLHSHWSFSHFSRFNKLDKLHLRRDNEFLKRWNIIFWWAKKRTVHNFFSKKRKLKSGLRARTEWCVFKSLNRDNNS